MLPLKHWVACGICSLLLCPISVFAADPLGRLSDDFSNPSTHVNWKRLDKVEGTAPTFSRIDFGQTHKGVLTIVPTTSVWYMDDTATMLFKTVRGNFMITAYVVTRSANDPSSAPTTPFNSAGVIVRDPRSRPGAQNWIVCNVGMQQSATGSEVKNTRNSVSVLELQNGPAEGEVRLARIHNTFYMLRRLKGETHWRELKSITRPDMPSALQVGVMCNGYQSADLIAQFHYAHFATPHSQTDLFR